MPASNLQDTKTKTTFSGVDLYYELLRSYLRFFMPSLSSINSFSPSKSKSNIESGVNLFTSKYLDSPQKCLNTAEFFYSSLIEIWCCQNDYLDLRVKQDSQGPINKDKLYRSAYIRPSSIQINCLSILISQLYEFDFRAVTGDFKKTSGHKPSVPSLMSTPLPNTRGVGAYNAGYTHSEYNNAHPIDKGDTKDDILKLPRQGCYRILKPR